MRATTGLLGVASECIAIKTGGGGAHVYLHVNGLIPPGQKLAYRPTANPKKPELLIETRGQGNYVVAPGSPASVHKSGIPYEIFLGSFESDYLIAREDFEELIAIARSLDEMPEPEPPQSSNFKGIGNNRPRDDFNERASFDEILPQHGFKKVKEENGAGKWQKPNSSDGGHHITTNYNGSGLLRCFSTSCQPFEGNKSYTKFSAYALLEHGGNRERAEAELAKQGYGTVQPKLDDIGNAERFVSQHGNIVCWVPEAESWFIWNGKVWEPDNKQQAMALAKLTARSIYNEAELESDNTQSGKIANWAKQSASTQRIKAMLELSRPELVVPAGTLDNNSWLLNAQNGIVDLKTGELLPHEPDQLLTKICPVAFNPNAESPRWEKFLLEVCAGKLELASFLQRAVGYSICGDQREQALFFCHGMGANGKSTFINAIRMILGNYAMEAAPEMLLQKNKTGANNDIARIVGARFVTTTETAQGRKLDENKTKQLTGSDKICARFLWKEYFEFDPTHTLWLISNNKPTIEGQDHAIWRRVKLIPFTVKFDDGTMDKQLPELLKQEAEGILAWCVQGCLGWQKSGLNEPDVIKSATSEYKTEMDQIQTFINECCVQDANESVSSAELYKRYKDWCYDIGEPSASNNSFGRRLNELDFQTQHTKKGNVRRGVGLYKPAPQDLFE